MGAAKAGAASQIAAESGRTKITPAVMEGLVSWPQVIEQSTIPLLPRCSQFMGDAAGVTSRGTG
jgi:hypothetical protein